LTLSRCTPVANPALHSFPTRRSSDLSAPLYVDARDLAASTNETHTVPTGADYVIFSADGDFYAKPNGAAAVPSDVTDGTASELRSEEHTSELQSRFDLVCRLLLEKKK